jgi:tRNA 2-selenouridine synthase
MALKFSSLSEFENHGYDAVIDVRSPAEFAQDHITAAINLPVLSDEERARVGTIYSQDNAFSAKIIGAALVARNVAAHLDGPLADKGGGWRPLVYCWRGGQRSGAFATILAQVGWRTEVVAGGYQTYRKLVARAMHDVPLPHRLIVLDGNTGTAKTELLQLLAQRGQQIVDLEGLAAHRGSVFGAVSRPQPSQKAFEAAIAWALERCDPARPVLVEAESSKIGDLLIPPSVWKAMKAAPRLSVAAPIAARAAYLTRTYGDIAQDRTALCETLAALIPHQGRERVEHWQGLVQSGDMRVLATELMRDHYDPRYAKARALRSHRKIGEVRTDDLTLNSLERTADRLALLIDEALKSLENP